jgi:hypothetical protein
MKFIKKILLILDDSLKDNATGMYSHARIISMLIAFGGTVFMWKLILIGGMTFEYFVAYLAYGTGHQTLNKFLDTRHAPLAQPDEYPKPPKVRAPLAQPDEYPKPPKN